LNTLTQFFRLILFVAPAAAMLPAARRLVQYFQLSSYQAGGYLRALRRQAKQCWWPGFALSASSIILILLASFTSAWHPILHILAMLFCASLILLCGFTIGQITYREKNVKTRLVVTSRVRRLYAALLIAGFLLSWLLFMLVPLMGMSALIPLLMPIWLLAAGLALWPFEKLIQLLYRLDAQRILEDCRKGGLQVIGITGSYGKTTVKNILHAMMAQRYPTLASPASFNTPMGLARCIREELGQQHLFFIAEMGARHPQDIRVLSRFIKPSAGILTSIGPQHLETLGSIQRVMETKYELIRSLPEDGFAVFNFDGKHVSGCYEKAAVPKVQVGIPGSDLWAEEMALHPEGSGFTLCLPTGERVLCESRLAGEHNVRNILLAAAMAIHFGISLQQIQHALLEVNPPPSRLQVSTHSKGYKVINNGFNSNPDSSRKALQVLSSYPGRLIVITPGFIELGRQEELSNRRLGNDIAAVAQSALLIGEIRTRPIKQGLLESGMREEDIYVFSSLDEANTFILESCGPDDVVLYENDLPDHYS
jgi:UDP-N-acetylmuramoyl-tripeptide--D-alanyl-D-alanine ligase